MAAKKGEVVYRRPKIGFEDINPESWTDLAICDAYDKAVTGKESPMSAEPHRLEMDKNKDKVKYLERQKVETEKEQIVVWSKSTSNGLGNKNLKSMENKTVESEQNGLECNWRVGDECVALYYEDGLYYDCTIISINKSAGTCVVEFTGYGNKETVDLSDLHNAEKWNTSNPIEDNILSNKDSTASSTSSSYTSTTTSSLSSTEGTSSDVTQDIYKSKGTKKKKKGHPANHGNYPPFQHMRHMAPPTFTTDSLFSMPPPPPFMGRHFSAFGPFPHNMTPNTSKLPDLSDDALSSMLMSWYMAGYHTGYYQGVNSTRDRKKRQR